ncbi:MAG: hypothetical protein ACLQO1_07755 [Steroidobacteraceae bacterium]
MSFDIASLTARESFWDTTGVWLAIAVAVGVAMEAVTEFDILAEWLRLDTQETYAIRHGIAKAGLLILIVALAFEVVAAIKTHQINGDIINGLNTEIGQTQTRERELINETNDLRESGKALEKGFSTQEQSLGLLGARTAEFEKTAKTLTDRTNDSLRILKEDEANLEKARSDVLVSAAKVETVLAAARSKEVDLTSSLRTISDLQQRLHELTTDRMLSFPQRSRIIEKVKNFGTVSFDISVTRDTDSPPFGRQIGLLLREANWDWQPRATLDSLVYPGIPALGGAVLKGLQIEVCQEDSASQTIVQPVNALIAALASEGYAVATFIITDDETKKSFMCGRVHFIVGSKL